MLSGSSRSRELEAPVLVFAGRKRTTQRRAEQMPASCMFRRPAEVDCNYRAACIHVYMRCAGVAGQSHHS